ncbi:MAG TPA: outer membrane beta-barrel protein [Paludibacteraceae bacterium]|nr:outer membrane beta-barrel protein [Paludibacteraceae bacterium]
MKKEFWVVLFLLLIFSSKILAQFGVKIGINEANEVITSSNLSTPIEKPTLQNLTAYHIGVIYQYTSKIGLGFDIGTSFSQKGCFLQSDSICDIYRELNYIEIPFNIRYRLSWGIIGIYGFGGLYGAYLLKGQKITETNTSSIPEKFSYTNFNDRTDYGYTFGGGIEIFKKIQLEANWNKGLKENIYYTNSDTQIFTTKNNVFSFNLTFIF